MTPDDCEIRKCETLTQRYPGLDVLVADPANAQTASRVSLASYFRSRQERYIRTHHSTPDIVTDDWTVSLTGLVDRETDLSESARSSITARSNRNSPWEAIEG